MAAAPSPAASLTGLPEPPAPGPDMARRIRWLMLLRTLVISIVLGVSYWLSWIHAGVTTGTSAFLSSVIAATYALTLIWALLLRRGVDPARLIWPQLAGDIVVTTAIVYATGGALSAYTFLFPLSIVGAGAVRFARGAVIVSLMSVVLMTAAALTARYEALPLPMVPYVAPWTQPAHDFGRTLALHLASIVAVGALSYVFGDQLRRAAASLATERRVVADLVTLHQDIVRSLTSGLITVDPEGEVLTLNSTAVPTSSASIAERAVGRDLDDVLPGIRAKLAPLPPRAPLRRADLTIDRAAATWRSGSRCRRWSTSATPRSAGSSTSRT